MSNLDSQRTYELRVRCTEEEKNQIQAKAKAAGRGRVAQWMRETCLGASVKDRRKYAPVDPQLIAAVNRIGNNLNQLTRTVNSVGLNDENAINLIGELADIEALLSALIDIEVQRNVG